VLGYPAVLSAIGLAERYRRASRIQGEQTEALVADRRARATR